MLGLDLYMNGFLVGSLTKKTSGAHYFQYHPEWLQAPGCRPISLSLPLQAAPHAGDKVYHFFDNLLPDSLEIRERIVRRLRASSTQAFDLLEAIGKDTVGAIQFVPQGTVPQPYQTIRCTPLDDQAFGNILKGYQAEHPLGMLNPQDDFRISLAGAQEKTALLYHQERWNIPLGATPTSHIFKLPIGYIRTHTHTLDLSESVENEYLCMRIAQAYGLPTPKTQIVSVDGLKALAVERFDRIWNQKKLLVRIPQEDCCQALGIAPGIKYESHGGPGINEIMHLLQGSSRPLHDRHLFMCTQVLFWLLAATDGHAKNFSIFIRPSGAYELTPLYDIISLFPVLTGAGGHIRDAKLAMGLKGSKGKKYQIEQIRARHFLATAKATGFQEAAMQQILDHFIQKTPRVIEQVQAELPAEFPQHISESIFAGLRKQAFRLEPDA